MGSLREVSVRARHDTCNRKDTMRTMAAPQAALGPCIAIGQPDLRFILIRCNERNTRVIALLLGGGVGPRCDCDVRSGGVVLVGAPIAMTLVPAGTWRF